MSRIVKPNPFTLPNIVSNVLQNFSDVTFLGNLRLVCHCWNEEICRILRSKTTITFESKGALQRYNALFTNTLEMFGTFPHSKYVISLRLEQDLASMNKPQEDNSEVLQEELKLFLNAFGSHISSINVPMRRGSSEPHTLDLILNKIPNLFALGLHFSYFDAIPCEYKLSDEAAFNLRSVHRLTVQVDGIEMSEVGTCSILEMLFEHMPNLQRITYPGDIRRISKVGLLLRDIILDSETGMKKLSEWEFKTRLLEEEALKLLCKEFPMKMLHLDLWNPEDDFYSISSELMSGLLRKWSESLEVLAVEFPWRKEVSFHFNFPLTMKNLTFLYLGGFEGSLIELLGKLPCLKQLELSQLDLLSIVPKPQDEKFESVKKLRLDFCTGQTAGVLSRFSRIFPELRTLNINHATNEVARIIFQKMGKLLTLRMHGHDLTDAGLCGFSESTLKEMDFLKLSSVQGNDYRKYSFIADLKELRYLKLDAYNITDITVRHGLVHCLSLQLVKIDCTGSSSACDNAATVFRKFKLSEYNNHLVEEGAEVGAMVELKEEPPLDEDALTFFQSHNKCIADLVHDSQ